MAHTLIGRLIANTLLTGTDEEMILKIVPTGALGLPDLIDRMKEENTGLRRETIEHVVQLYHRTVSEAVLDGYIVNTDLYRAEPQAHGYIKDGAWNPQKNSIYVSFGPSTELRQEAARTQVVIRGMAQEKRYIAGVEDTATHATDGTATPGRCLIVRGRYIKIVGDPDQVGLTLVSDQGVETRIPPELITLNYPTQILFLLPADLDEGAYTLTIATQFSDNPKKPLRVPRVLTYPLLITQR